MTGFDFSHDLVQHNVPLSALTTIHIGGPAAYFARVTRAEDITDLVRQADEAGIPVMMLGGGSNLLVGDEGFDGFK